MEILSVKNLSFTYPMCKEKALDDVTLKINEGDFVVVCGNSGSGKTTLLKYRKSVV